MKRWLKGLLVFVAALVSGYGVAQISLFGVLPIRPGVIDEISPTVVAIYSPEAESVSEFPKVSIPEEFESTDYRHFQTVDKGSAYLRLSEMDAGTKGPWLAMFKRGTRYSLESLDVSIGPTLSDDFGRYHRLRFRDSKKAMILLSNSSELRPGPVTTLHWTPRSFDDNKAELLGDGYRREFALGGRTYVLRVGSGTTIDDIPASVLVLESEGKQDILYYRSYLGNGTFGALVWVGDLDNDGKLDLHFSYFDVNGGGQSDILFISSFAKEGHLVQPYAFFHARGF
ncbi:MAG TPA: hypothetical protein VK468_03305 [Pyrinomonadaceae bacterium]|nr:hypothetical protein [Pyrinomonadaceae bacterium]